MIENPKFTLEILKYFAREDIRFPANVSVEDLQNVFPQKKRDEIIYHLVCCHKNDLLILNLIHVQQHDGVQYIIDLIDGLSPRGGEYLRNSRSKYWDKACSELSRLGIALTTENIIPCLTEVVRKAMQDSL